MMTSDSDHRTADPLGLIAIEQHAPGRYLGTCIDGTIGRVFGGQALAHALRSASRSINDARPAHSLHAYFASPGRSSAPIDYTTSTIKAGRAIDIVGVRSEQFDRTLLVASASFHEAEESDEFQLPMPDIPGPDAYPSSDYVPRGTNPAVRAPFDLRYPLRPQGASLRGTSEIATWVRTRNAVESKAAIDHAALLAYMIDFLLTRSAHFALGDHSPQVGASLDHAMWFHRPFRMDQWLLVSSESQTFAGSRSLCTAHVFTREGDLVATATQEALIRRSAAGAEAS